MTSFLDYEGSDPADSARKAGAAFSRAKHDIEKQGVKSFLFHASSVEEFDERAKMREVSSVLDGVADKYLNEVSDGRAKLARSLRREFTGQNPGQPPLPPDIEAIRADAESAAKEQARIDVAKEKARLRGPQHDHDDPPGVEVGSCPACRAKYGYPPMDADPRADAQADAMADARQDAMRDRTTLDNVGDKVREEIRHRRDEGTFPSSDPRADAEAAAREQARRDVGDARRGL